MKVDGVSSLGREGDARGMALSSPGWCRKCF